jgi:hypothetical protein
MCYGNMVGGGFREGRAGENIQKEGVLPLKRF